MVIVACVKTGERYSDEYVYRLRAMVARHLPVPHRFVCITDRKVPGVECASTALPIWWAKMQLFHPAWRDDRVIYFDLDTVIVGDLSPLLDVHVTFGICANFTRAAGNLNWPCKYGSCVMTIAPSFGEEIWSAFRMDAERLIAEAGKYGDQWVIEKLYPHANLLQEMLPPKFFLGYRDLSDEKPEETAVVVFAGKQKPHNTKFEWVRREWAQ